MLAVAGHVSPKHARGCCTATRHGAHVTCRNLLIKRSTKWGTATIDFGWLASKSPYEMQLQALSQTNTWACGCCTNAAAQAGLAKPHKWLQYASQKAQEPSFREATYIWLLIYWFIINWLCCWYLRHSPSDWRFGRPASSARDQHGTSWGLHMSQGMKSMKSPCLEDPEDLEGLA